MPDISNISLEQRAQIMREERDALILAWQNGVIVDLLGAERLMNARIEGLGVESITGDTTEN